MRVIRQNNINTILVEDGDTKMSFSDWVTTTSTTTLTIPSTNDEFTFINTSGSDWSLNAISELKINNSTSSITISNNQSISLRFEPRTKAYIITGRSDGGSGGGVTAEDLALKQSIALTSNTPTPSAFLDWTPDIIDLVLTANTTVTAITNGPASGGTLMVKITGNYTFKFSGFSFMENGRHIPNVTNYASIFFHPSGQFVINWFNDFISSSKNYIYEDFESVSSTAVGKLILVNNSGYIADGTNANADLKGIVELHTNTSASAKPFIGTSVKAYQLFSHKYDSTWYVKTPSSLSDGSQTYQILCGYLSSNNTLAQQFGAYFKYDYNGTTVADADDNITPSVTWKIVNSKDTTIANKTYTDSTVTVVASTWYKFRIVFSSTQVLFYINDVLRLTYTGANIPTGSFNYFGAGLTIQKSVGTSDRVLQADYFEQLIDTYNGI
jgi:hypothetical protein